MKTDYTKKFHFRMIQEYNGEKYILDGQHDGEEDSWGYIEAKGLTFYVNVFGGPAYFEDDSIFANAYLIKDNDRIELDSAKMTLELREVDEEC